MQLRALTILLVAAALPAAATPLLTLSPADGAISGTPGSTVGWGFSLSSDSANWLSATSSFLILLSDPTLLTYSDAIGLQGGPTGGVLPPNAPAWNEAFNAFAGTGIGGVTIASSAKRSETVSATLEVLYDEFAGNPQTCGSCYVTSNSFQELVSVDVTVTPEPGDLTAYGALSLALLAGLRRRMSPFVEDAE